MLGFLLAWVYVGLVHVVSLCEFICASALLGLENNVFWESSITSYHLPPRPLSLEGRYNGDGPFRAECSGPSLSTCDGLWVSVFITVYWKKKLLWQGLSNTVIRSSDRNSGLDSSVFATEFYCIFQAGLELTGPPSSVIPLLLPQACNHHAIKGTSSDMCDNISHDI